MILVILCVIIGGYFSYKKVPKDVVWSLRAITQMIGLIAGLFVGVILALIFSAVMPRAVERYEFEKVKLVALGNGNAIQGSFFLASGNIGTEQYYKFYYETPDGGKKFGRIIAEHATVYEEDRKDAFMAKSGEQEIYSNQIYFWLVPKLLTIGNQWKYVIYVPKGTIKTEYNLDLK